MVPSHLLAIAFLSPTTAEAGGFWDLPQNEGWQAGVSLVVSLGPAEDRSRFGVGLDVGRQWFWHEGPYHYDVDDHVAPLATVALHTTWTRPFVSASITALAGPMYPWKVGDGGFQPLAGVQVGAGLGLSTDGAAGPVFVGEILGPWSDVRFDVTRWQGAWHAPRLSLGLNAELNCCDYLD